MQNQLQRISFFDRTKITTECISTLSNDFNTKKQNLLNLIQTKYPDALDIDGNKLILELQNADSPEKLKWVVEDLLKHINDHHSNNVKKLYDQLGRQEFKKFVPKEKISNMQQEKKYTKQGEKLEKNFEIQQAKYNSTRAYNDDLFELLKLVTSPSCDKRVIEIEEMLKQKYGLQYVSLYDYANAKKVEEGLKILSSQTKLPQNILVTPQHFLSSQTGRHLIHTDGTQTILLNPIEIDLINIAKGISKDSEKSIRQSFIADTCIKEINDSSTNHPAHTVVHEVLHGENNWFTSMFCIRNFDIKYREFDIFTRKFRV